MSLEADGVPILTYGDFNALIAGLDDTGASIEPLVAWRAGEPVPPLTLYLCLQVPCRERARTDLAHQLIDAASDRLEEAFPEMLGAIA